MEFEKVEIEGLILCKPKLIYDNRGFFSEVFRKDLLEKITGKKLNFCQSNTSESTYGTIRGLHFQIFPSSQSKLVSVSKGEILDIALDIRKNSNTYGKYYSVILNDNNNFQLYIPRGFAHGFSVLSKEARVHYQVDNYYDKQNELGINPLDNDLAIDWKISKEKYHISRKDLTHPDLKNIKIFKF
ncbi:MAG: dTDP-4-dehydrorhamnose 3,5-epimerase [Flavobacteriaceae bacterium]|nr:dTDP-4-dehydrorhamnose 3,5-epimerase [Flavobacteriaceae bacterium]|tara:strand:- start:2176 stop:2730 length:555 start_codon:yes stop_codon:yes gene_type:complete